jgi:hypothetical protein
MVVLTPASVTTPEAPPITSGIAKTTAFFPADRRGR